MSDIEFRPAWALNDTKIQQDTKAFWRAMHMLGPAEIERRASELCAAAYAGDTLIAVSTAALGVLPQLRSRFAMYRCMVAPEYRRHHVSYQISGYSRELLEKWSLENPQERIVGMAAIIQANEYKSRKQREPLWPEYGLNLNLVGYNNVGDQVRVAWFKHALVE